MKIFYYEAEKGNLGDDLNAWLWPALLDPAVLNQNDNVIMLGIGTIIGKSLPEAEKYIICTSGVGYSSSIPDITAKNWDVISVRGPLSAAALNLPDGKAITDGAILLAEFPELMVPPENRNGVVFMPHLSAANTMNWSEICQQAGVEYLGPGNELHSAIARLAAADMVLADAMHAAIIADTLRTPWRPLASSSEISTFKWLDWTLSMEVPYRPTYLPARSLSMLCLEAHLWLKRSKHRFEVDGDAKLISMKHFNEFKSFGGKLKKWHYFPCVFFSKALRRLSEILSKTKFGTTIILGKDRTIALLKEQASESGYLSDIELANRKRQDLKKTLYAKGLLKNQE